MAVNGKWRLAQNHHSSQQMGFLATVFEAGFGLILSRTSQAAGYLLIQSTHKLSCPRDFKHFTEYVYSERMMPEFQDSLT